jgi:hypothetical protein
VDLMLCMRHEFPPGKMQVDLLTPKGECLAPVPERNGCHSEDALVKGAALFDTGNSKDEVIDGVYVHRRAFTRIGLGIGLPHVCMRLIFVSSPDVQCCEPDLQSDKCIGVIVPTPEYPQRVAEKEAPESEFSPSLCL